MPDKLLKLDPAFLKQLDDMRAQLTLRLDNVDLEEAAP